MSVNQKSVELNSVQGIDGNNIDAADGEQYLTFIMDDEEYGVDILAVQEIRGWEAATPLPNAPPHVKGVINLRGTIVPIIDLRQCFGMAAIEYSAVTVVIVLKVENDEGDKVMGIVVDAVSDVYSLTDGDLQTAPDLGGSVSTEVIKGLVSVKEKMVILLDINQLLTLEDIPNLNSIKEKLEAESA